MYAHELKNSLKILSRIYFSAVLSKTFFFINQEHKCVLDSCRSLEADGFEVTYLPVLPSGLVDLNLLKSAIKPTTVLVSVMAVNNEIGVSQPLAEIG